MAYGQLLSLQLDDDIAVVIRRAVNDGVLFIRQEQDAVSHAKAFKITVRFPGQTLQAGGGDTHRSNRHIIIADAENANYESSKSINKNYDYINRWQWGVKTAVNYDFISVYAKMRTSDLLKTSYPGSYSDFLRLEVGMQMTFTFHQKAMGG